jgi:hypothetical protein
MAIFIDLNSVWFHRLLTVVELNHCSRRVDLGFVPKFSQGLFSISTGLDARKFLDLFYRPKQILFGCDCPIELLAHHSHSVVERF